ncbi:MAG: YHS domain-containing protein [Alphaproteobacteria bacterium]
MSDSSDDSTHTASPNQTRDPVCGMTVNPLTTQNHATYRGQDFYFCSAHCHRKFLTNPAMYLAPKSSSRNDDPNTFYTCPMHPEIQQQGPGACPICGMALEPSHPSPTSESNPEMVAMTYRFWIGLGLTLPVFTLEMGGHLLGQHNLLPFEVQVWVETVRASYGYGYGMPAHSRFERFCYTGQLIWHTK